MTGQAVDLIDTHCHLDFDRFDGERDEIVERAMAAGVGRMIVPALDLSNCPTVLRLAERYEAVYAAVGVHPNSTAEWQPAWVEAVRDFAGHEKVVAIGEIGIDYHWDLSPPATQRRAFAAQLELAADLALPVIVHNREAAQDVLSALADSSLNSMERPGVLHSFSGGAGVASTAVEMGYYLGFTGPITFKRADELRSIAATVPLERLLVETDAPFLTPEPFRGRRNEPAFVRHVAQRLAEVRGLSLHELARATSANAAALFGPGLAKAA